MMNHEPPPPGFMPPPPYEAKPSAPGPYMPHHMQGVMSQPQYPSAPPEVIRQVVVVNSPVILGPQPQRLRCPNCQADIVTKVETCATRNTHLMFLLCCLLGCWPCAPCVLLYR